jgi:hypothetical protein
VKEFQGTIVAIVLLLILGLAWSMQQNGDFEESVLICAISPSKLDYLKIKNEHGLFTVRRDKEGKWIVEVPGSSEKEWATDAKARDSLLNSVSRLQADRWMKKPPSAHQLGLEKPSFVVEVSQSDGQKTRLSFGKVVKTAGTIYAKKEGDERIFSIAEARIIPLRQSPMALRDRKVATVPFARVTKVTLRNQSEEIVINKIGEGIFSLSSQVELRAFPPKVRSLTEEISNLRADGFSDLAQKSAAYFGFDKPKISIDIQFEKPMKPVRLLIGKRHPDSSSIVFMRNEERAVAYHIRAEQLVALLASKDEYRDRTPFTLPGEPFDFVEVIDYRDKKDIRRAALTKKMSRWDLHSFEKEAKNIGQEFLAHLKNIRANSYRRIPSENLAVLGMHEPLFHLGLTAANDPHRWFKIGRAESGRIYVQLPDGAVAGVGKELIETLSQFVVKYGEQWPRKK